MRARVAGAILGLSEKTVRAWVHEGVLVATATDPRLLLDPARLWQVWRLVRDLRAAGQERGLIDEVWRRLSDAAVLSRADLAESLHQMHQGETEVVVTRAEAARLAAAG